MADHPPVPDSQRPPPGSELPSAERPPSAEPPPVSEQPPGSEQPSPSGERPPDGATVAWRALLDETVALFQGEAHIENPRFEARQLLLRVTGATSAEWYNVEHQPATVRGVAALDALVARRRTGEPLQYVLGEWDFRQLNLLVDRRVLIPRPETEQVVERALAELRRIHPPTAPPDDRAASPKAPPPRSVDLGTGSGAIGLSLAHEFAGAEVWLTDISSDALAVAQANLAGLGMAGSRVRIAQGSWFEALPSELAGTVSLVVANPPYVAAREQLDPSVHEWEPASALVAGETGTEHLELLVAGAGRWLRPDGALVMEMAPWQTASTAQLAGQHFQEVEVGRDLQGKSRMVVARHPYGSAAE